MCRLRVLERGLDDLEDAGERDAETAGDLRQKALGLFAEGKVDRRTRRQLIEDGLETDGLVDPAEGMGGI